MEAMRESWTDDRMDDLAKRVDTGFTQVHEDISALRAETHQDIAGLRADRQEDIAGLRADHRELRRDMAALDRGLGAEISQLATREELQTEISALRLETQQGFATLNQRFDALQRTLIAGILAGFIGLLITHFG